MSHIRSLFSVALCVTGLAGLLSAQQQNRLFVLPGSTSTASVGTIYDVSSPSSLSPIQNIGVFPGAYRVFAQPGGQKYFIASTAVGQPVYVVDQNGSNGRTLTPGLNQSASVVTMSPDGKRLAIIIGATVYLYDTSTTPETLLTGTGLTIAGSEVRLVDATFAQDSSALFVLGNMNSGSRIYRIDLANNTVSGTNDVVGQANSITVAPNSLLYITAQNQITEFDGRTPIPTPRLSGTIAVNGVPGKPAFSLNSRYLVAPNLNPATGQSLAFVVDLQNTSRVVTPVSGGLTGMSFSNIYTNGQNRFLAFSASTGMIYDMTVTPGSTQLVGLSQITYGLTPTQGITSVALSNELPNGFRNSAAFLYYLTNNGSLYKIDLNLSQQAGVQANQAAGAIAAYAGPAVTTGAAQSIAINDAQAAPLNSSFLPLVIRVVDGNGRPVWGVPVTWAINNGTFLGSTASSVTSNTSPEGYASIQVVSPSAAALITVTATPQGLDSKTYQLTAGSTTPGGGGVGQQIAISSGNGQLVQEFNLAQPLVVLVTDPSGTPVVGANVTWNLTNGSGTVQAGQTQTDSKGLATTTFVGSGVPFGYSYQTSTLNAALDSGASVNFTINTFLGTLPGGGLAAPPLVRLLKPTTDNNLVTVKAGQTITGAIQAIVVAGSGLQAGQAIPGVGIRISTGDGGPTATCANAPLSDNSGNISCDLNVLGKPGTYPATVIIGEALQFGLTLKVTAGDPSVVKKEQGDNQSGNPSSVLPLALRVQVTDAYGNLLPGITVSWTVASGSATLQNTINVTDGTGRASTLVKLGASGDSTIKVTAGTASATFTVKTNVIVGGVSVVSGDRQTAVTNQVFAQPLVVRVTDANNVALAGIPVTFAITGGSASLSATTAASDATGNAQVQVTAGASAGTITITASAGAGSAATFTLTSRLPGPVVSADNFVNSASGAKGVSPCGLASIYGTGMLPGLNGTATASSITGPWPTTFQGVSVSFNGILAPIYSATNLAGREQLNIQVPCELSAGSANVTINVAGGSPTTVTNVPVLAANPGIFEYTTEQNTKQAVLIKADGSFVTPSNPAVRGETIRMIATGLGQVSPATATGRAGIGGQQVLANLVAGVNNAGADVVSTEYFPNMIGLYIVSFKVPDDAPSGTRALALAVRNADGTLVFGNGSNIPIQ